MESDHSSGRAFRTFGLNIFTRILLSSLACLGSPPSSANVSTRHPKHGPRPPTSSHACARSTPPPLVDSAALADAYRKETSRLAAHETERSREISERERRQSLFVAASKSLEIIFSEMQGRRSVTQPRRQS